MFASAVFVTLVAAGLFVAFLPSVFATVDFEGDFAVVLAVDLEADFAAVFAEGAGLEGSAGSLACTSCGAGSVSVFISAV